MDRFERVLPFLYGFLLVALLGAGTPAYAQHYKFRIYLKDKGPSQHTIERPDEFLSAASIERRRKQGIDVNESDLPLSRVYLDSIARAGVQIVTQSKWLRTVVVEAPNADQANALKCLSFVDSVKQVWRGTNDAIWSEPGERPSEEPPCEMLDDPYGYGGTQIRMNNGDRLHAAGFRGQGMRIAVIDAGFTGVDRLPAFDSTRIAGSRNFVLPEQSVYAWSDHGTKVLACLAAHWPGILIGTAPEAEYWLLKSEDTRSEFPVEEDYWTAAVEYADSIGADVISSSLGYFTFDDGDMGYGKEALDGKTAQISRAAEIAAGKGILLFSSAGNEGNSPWEKISFPADAPSIVTVGAVTPHKIRSSFSSKGLTADCRIKPDVMAMGSECYVFDTDGSLQSVDGSSFATPILAGLGACLWQALPELSSREIARLLREAADHAGRPDAETGYGIPDVYRAYLSCRPEKLPAETTNALPQTQTNR